MSGQRNKKPDDIIKNRQEYLDNLNLQIQLQDMNEQAVKQYKDTGQLPPITQMKDNRTIEDKLRDYEKIKQSIREDLAPVASPQLANMIIQKILQSPFNQDNSLLIFFAQRASDLAKNLQKSYKFGIKGDDNDASQFVSFIEKFYSDKNNITSNAKQFMARLGANTQQSLAKKADEQANILTRLDAEINRINLDLTRSLPNTAEFRDFKLKLRDYRRDFVNLINAIREIYPAGLIYGVDINGQNITLTRIEESFNNLMLQNLGLPAQFAISEDFKLFLGYINHNIPNTDYTNALINTLSKNAETLKRNKSRVEIIKVLESFENIYNQIQTGETVNEINLIVQAKNRILQYIRGAVPPPPPGGAPPPPPGGAPPPPPGGAPPPPPGGAPPPPPFGGAPPPFGGYPPPFGGVPPPEEPEAEPEAEPEGFLNRPDVIPERFNPEVNYGFANPMPQRVLDDLNHDIEYIEQLVNDNGLQDRRVNINGTERFLNQGGRNSWIQFIKLMIPRQNVSTTLNYIYNLYDIVNNFLGRRPNYNPDILRSGRGFKMFGSGINPAYKFTKQKVNPYEGVQEDPRYIKFGRYLVNTKRLKDDVLSLRREKGTPIASLPAYKMTRPFKNVVNKIIGGALPSSEDFNELTDDEKRYLHKVSKEADLSHKLEIPTPSKDEDEKDEHLFNVYKGEIMAGNDNKEMVKKFKLLLMKLSRKNYINKNEANDILEMLTNAGY